MNLCEVRGCNAELHKVLSFLLSLSSVWLSFTFSTFSTFDCWFVGFARQPLHMRVHKRKFLDPERQRAAEKVRAPPPRFVWSALPPSPFLALFVFCLLSVRGVLRMRRDVSCVTCPGEGGAGERRASHHADSRSHRGR